MVARKLLPPVRVTAVYNWVYGRVSPHAVHIRQLVAIANGLDPATLPRTWRPTQIRPDAFDANDVIAQRIIPEDRP